MSQTTTITRLVVLLFSDIVGSVELKSRLGDAEAAQIIAQHDRLFRRTFDAVGDGEILKDTGDGFLARFNTVSNAAQLSPGAGIYTHPRFIATGPANGWAFWTRQRDGRWEVVNRRLVDDRWEPLHILAENAMLPAAATVQGRIVLAYERHADTEQIALRTWDGSRWTFETILNDNAAPSYRPTLAAAPNGEVWAFWDTYLAAERGYAVFGRRVAPDLGPAARLSPPFDGVPVPSSGRPRPDNSL